MEQKVRVKSIKIAAFSCFSGFAIACAFVPCVWAAPFGEVVAPIEPIAPIVVPEPIDNSEYVEMFDDDEGPVVVKKLPSALMWDDVAETFKQPETGDEYVYSKPKGAVSKFREKYDKKPILKPKPIIPVAQRVEILEDKSFVILPEDAPLPNGTISRDLLDEEPVLEVGPVRQEGEEVGSEVQKLMAKLIEGAGGELFLKLEGNSDGGRIENLPARKGTLTGGIEVKDKMAELIDKVSGVEVKVEPKKIVKSKPKPKIMGAVVHSAKITFFADSVSPNSMEPVKKLAAKLKGKKISKLHVTAQNTVPPLGIGEKLPMARWAQVMKVFSAEGVSLKGVQTSEILLNSGETQFLEIEIE